MTNIYSKAWCWQHKGEPGELILKDFKLRDLEEDEILVQNSVIGLNPVDWKLISSGNPSWNKNQIPGVDGAGIVVKTGSKMKQMQIGARVCYHSDLTQQGSFATHTIIKGNRCMQIPETLSNFAAAAFPCPTLTAWQSFCKIPDLVNKNVLISGAGGSVGYLLTQLALNAGAKVYVTSDVHHHHEYYKMGVVKAVDYKNNNWNHEIKEILHGNLFDVIFDTVSGAHAASLLPLIAYYGHMVAIQDRVAENTLPPFTTCVSLHEIALGAFHQYATNRQIAQLMEDGENLLQQISNGKLKQRDQKINSFENLPAHLADMKKNNSYHKYLIEL
ncbi:zinc-binding dehydrogenase [uncultured Apibacter sp.]|uniref:alcohol dehydrogenase catalytic domain-containing protein n=2 Tax=Apibacter TaxID=1778601 RepID=UPI002600FE35|nr:zinc-binding dehydrogenase [uncultured Apibacter sp.]